MQEMKYCHAWSKTNAQYVMHFVFSLKNLFSSDETSLYGCKLAEPSDYVYILVCKIKMVSGMH